MIPSSKDMSPQLSHHIEEALTHFFSRHGKNLPRDLHALAMATIEKPLLKLVMKQADNNQSLAAKMLGLNRATLRKKLTDYKLLDK